MKIYFKNWVENTQNKAIRYIHKDGRGLMNNQSLNYDKLDDDEHDEVQTEYLGLQQPPYDLQNQNLTFVFTPEGEQKHKRLIDLLTIASKKGVIRQEIDLSQYQIVWTSSDGQLALKNL